MSAAWQRALAGARHVAKHKSIAKFQDDAGQNSEQYDEAVQAFNAYTEQVKVLAQQVAEFKLAAGEAYRKVGAVAESIVSLTEEDGGQLALHAVRLRTVVARIQAAMMRKLIPDMENVLEPELAQQLEAFKDVKAKMAKRLHTVADANHYRDKCDKLKQQHERNPEKIDAEKMERNTEKYEQAKRVLEEETTQLLASFASFSNERVRMMTTRCVWLRKAIQIFFAEAFQAHSLTDEHVTSEHELLDVGVSRESIGETFRNRAKSVGTIAQSATMTLSHAVKHKGAIQHLFQGHNESIPDMGEGSYEISVDRFKRYEKEMNNLKLSLRLYLEGTSASLQGLSKVIETIVQMKLPSDPEQVTEVSSGFDASLSASREIIGEHLVATITQDCIEVLNTELQVYVEVTPLILRRKQTALDASHYAGKLKALQDKEKQDDAKLKRNKTKYDEAVRQLETETDQVMQLLAAFDEMRKGVLKSVMESIEANQNESFKLASEGLATSGTRSASDMGDAPPATPSAALPVATPVELQPPQPPTQTEEQQQQQPQEEEQQQQPTEEQRNSRAVEAAEPSGAGLSNGTAADVSEQSVPDSPVVPSQLQMHDDESSSTMMSAPPSRIKVKALFDFDGVQDGDLPFNEGEIFEADGTEYDQHEADSGWVTGWHKGSHGVFPSNYVQRL